MQQSDEKIMSLGKHDHRSEERKPYDIDLPRILLCWQLDKMLHWNRHEHGVIV